MKLSILIPVRAKLLYPFRYETPCSKQPTQLIVELNLSLRYIIVTLVMMKTVAVDASTQNPYP